MTTHTRLRLGAAALVFLLIALLSGSHLCEVALDKEASDPGMRPIGFGALACTEFWLNRYQTMIGACVALYAGWLALRGAKGQIEVAKLQLPLARQQAEAVRADRISVLLASTFDLAAIMSDFDDQVFRGWGAVEVIKSGMNVSWDPSAVVTLDEMDQTKREVISKYFLEADTIIGKLGELLPQLRKASHAAQVNPMLKDAPRCANYLINSVGQLKYKLSVLRRISCASRQEINAIIASPFGSEIDWKELQPLLNAARGEMENSIDRLQAQLFSATRGIVDN